MSGNTGSITSSSSASVIVSSFSFSSTSSTISPVRLMLEDSSPGVPFYDASSSSSSTTSDVRLLLEGSSSFILPSLPGLVVEEATKRRASPQIEHLLGHSDITWREKVQSLIAKPIKLQVKKLIISNVSIQHPEHPIVFSENNLFDSLGESSYSFKGMQEDGLAAFYSVIKVARLHIGMCDPNRTIEDNVEKCIELLAEFYTNEGYRSEIMGDSFLSFDHHVHGLSIEATPITVDTTTDHTDLLDELRTFFASLDKTITKVPSAEQRQGVLRNALSPLVKSWLVNDSRKKGMGILIPLTQCAIIKKIEAINSRWKEQLHLLPSPLNPKHIYDLLYHDNASILGQKVSQTMHAALMLKLNHLKNIQINAMADKVISTLRSLQESSGSLQDKTVVVLGSNCGRLLKTALEYFIEQSE